MKELHELTTSQALRSRFELEAEFASTPSPTGYQLEAAQSRVLGQGHNGARPDSQEWKRIRLMDLMQLTKDLNRQELDALRLRYLTLATPEPYTKTRRLSDIQEGDGEEIVSAKALDDKGEPMEGYVVVKGFNVRYASHEAVADHMAANGVLNGDGQPMTHGAVKRRIEDGQAKTSTALKWLRFKIDTEENQG